MHPKNFELGTSFVMPSSSVALKKGVWSEAEDVLLTRYIEKYGPGNWGQVPLKAGLNRCGKSCRLRWFNYLHPDLRRGEFEPDEVDLIIRMHKLLGNRWTLIAGRVPGRTGNSIKNYYNTYLSSKKSSSDPKLPFPNMMTVENHHIMMTTKVIRPVPQKISERSPSIMNTASTPTGMNINTNINTTTTRFLPITNNSNDEERIKKSLIILDDDDTSSSTKNNNNALLGSENTASFHVEEGLKLQNETGNTDDFIRNFDAIQGLEDHADDSGNYWYNDLYFGADICSML